jgi:hypothetical protein
VSDITRPCTATTHHSRRPKKVDEGLKDVRCRGRRVAAFSLVELRCEELGRENVVLHPVGSRVVRGSWGLKAPDQERAPKVGWQMRPTFRDRK